MPKLPKKKQDKLPVKTVASPTASVAKFEEDFKKADNAISNLRDTWNDAEKMFFNDLKGKAAETAKSNVNDGHLSTAIIQRTQRVMAQLAIGKTTSLDSTNKGKELLMGMIVEKYIKPNANNQFKHLAKHKLVSMYSQIYGSMPVLLDYFVTDNYVGPDFVLIPMRQYYPQPGVYQENEMDYCYVDSFVSKDYLNNLTGDWKKENIDKVMEAMKEGQGKSHAQYSYQSYPETKWGGGEQGSTGKFARLLLRTRYERERWVTYSPDYPQAGLLRDIPNPHKNHKLPVLVKNTIPLLDRATGLGDVERGTPLQKTMNSVLNLSLDTWKYGLFSPIILNRSGVVTSSIKWEPLAIWEETQPNSIRQLQMSTTGTNNFQAYMGYLTSTINNLLGTNDASVSTVVDPSMGRTPQALKMQASKESAADAWERQSMEEFIEELYDRFIDMIATIQPKPIELKLFEGEIANIQATYPDIKEMYDEKSGKMTIKPDAIKGKYKFYINSGSTTIKDQVAENQAIVQLLGLFMQSPQFIQVLREKGKDIDFGELIQRLVATSGISDSDKIITQYVPPVAAPVQPGQPQMDQNGQPMAQDPNAQPMPGQQGQNPMASPQPGQQQGITQMPDLSQFQDPQIRAVAKSLFAQNAQNK